MGLGPLPPIGRVEGLRLRVVPDAFEVVAPVTWAEIAERLATFPLLPFRALAILVWLCTLFLTSSAINLFHSYGAQEQHPRDRPTTTPRTSSPHRPGTPLAGDSQRHALTRRPTTAARAGLQTTHRTPSCAATSPLCAS